MGEEREQETFVVHFRDDGRRGRHGEVAKGSETFDDDVVVRVGQAFDEKTDQVLGEEETERDGGEGGEKVGESRLRSGREVGGQ